VHLTAIVSRKLNCGRTGAESPHVPIVDLPPLTGSPLLDPWRQRYRDQLEGLLPPPAPRQPTRSEQMLWGRLVLEPEVWFAEHRTGGPYTLDFYCPSAELAVEIDGDSHRGAGMAEKEEVRDAWHLARGIRTKRFKADEVERHLDWVVKEIGVLLLAEPVQVVAPLPPVLALEPVTVREPSLPVGSWGNRLRACVDILPPPGQSGRWRLRRTG
jgi:very-short-patch-repair endonuclease